MDTGPNKVRDTDNVHDQASNPEKVPDQTPVPDNVPPENQSAQLSGWAHADNPSAGPMPPAQNRSPAPGPKPDRRAGRRLFFLALAGLIVNGAVIPLVLSLRSADTSYLYYLTLFVGLQLGFQLIMWAILYAIALRMLQRHGYRTALIFILVSFLITSLPALGCMGAF